jgi:radical SAM/Cys-rich protein
LGYGSDPNLIFDLVYNPQLPSSTKFSLAPNQATLEQDYKTYLLEHHQIIFNNLFAITNLPIGRTKFHLERLNFYHPYLEFLESNFNHATIENLMCRNELSIDYLGNVYDCDFNQMEGMPAQTGDGNPLTVAKLLASDALDLISAVRTANYCYGCTAGSGSSCGGALL